MLGYLLALHLSKIYEYIHYGRTANPLSIEIYIYVEETSVGVEVEVSVGIEEGTADGIEVGVDAGLEEETSVGQLYRIFTAQFPHIFIWIE